MSDDVHRDAQPGRSMQPVTLLVHRVLQQFTREDLAERAGCSVEYVIQLEEGRVTATPLSVKKLAHGLGVPERFLFIQPVDPDDLRQLVANEITLEQFRQKVYGLPATGGDDHTSPQRDSRPRSFHSFEIPLATDAALYVRQTREPEAFLPDTAPHQKETTHELRHTGPDGQFVDFDQEQRGGRTGHYLDPSQGAGGQPGAVGHAGPAHE